LRPTNVMRSTKNLIGINSWSKMTKKKYNNSSRFRLNEQVVIR